MANVVVITDLSREKNVLKRAEMKKFFPTEEPNGFMKGKTRKLAEDTWTFPKSSGFDWG